MDPLCLGGVLGIRMGPTYDLNQGKKMAEGARGRWADNDPEQQRALGLPHPASPTDQTILQAQVVRW